MDRHRMRARSRSAGPLVALLATVAVLLAACGGPPGGPGGSAASSGGEPPSSAGASHSIPLASTVPATSPAGSADASSASSSSPSQPAPSTPAPSVPPTGPDAAPSLPTVALQRAIDAWRTRAHVPGLSVTVLARDGRSWTGTSGLADVAARRPVTADTAFAVASMSKTFTSALVLELVEQGAVGLDVPVVRYLPESRLAPAITVRMLLDHTSGLFDVFFHPTIDRALTSAPAARWTTRQALSYASKPYFPPGTGWHYSNTNYIWLGLLVERVTGRPLGDVLRSRLFGPLGLTDSWYQPTEPARTTLTDGYRLVGTGAKTRAVDLDDGSEISPFTSVITALGGAGGIAATSGDLARWAAALYGGRVLRPETLAAAVADASATAGYHPSVPYGLGVQVVRYGRWLTYGHSGRLLGSRGQVRYVVDAGVALAILTNQSRVDVSPLMASLIAIVLPPPGPGSRRQ